MATPSLLIIPDRYKAAKLYSQIPESGAGDFTVTRGTTATRVNASGLIESVASGVPRIDYTGGGCGSLLVEPAATNLFLRSEGFNDAYWAKANTTISADAAVAPDGTTTADSILSNINTATEHRVRATTSMAINTKHTLSVFCKQITTRYAYLRDLTNNFFAVFDLQTGLFTFSSVGLSTSASIVNGFYRISITFTTPAVIVNNLIDIGCTSLNNNFASIVPIGNGIAIWGAQLETGSVATSYIPTVGSTVTRNADVISLSSVSGLIWSTEGTLYAEVNISKLLGATARTIFAIEAGTNRVQLFFTGLAANTLRALVRESSVTKYYARATITTTGIIKLAIAYKSLDSSFYVNGVKITNVLTNLSFGSLSLSDVLLGSADTNFLNDRISAAAIYTERLSDSELAQLTTL